MSHNMYIGPPIFPIFNDHLITSMEPVTEADFVPFTRSDNADMRLATNATWSSNCEWFFVALSDKGIALFNVYDPDRRGMLCTKHSGDFIRACLDNGILNKTIRGRRRASHPMGHRADG